jgi:hypothetical protein
MSDVKLFRTDGASVCELEGRSVALEKSLQTLIEKNLDVFLGIRFLASEYATGKTHGGRIDTLGIDENGCPCIIEYKRATNENVINQAGPAHTFLLMEKALRNRAETPETALISGVSARRRPGRAANTGRPAHSAHRCKTPEFALARGGHPS